MASSSMIPSSPAKHTFLCSSRPSLSEASQEASLLQLHLLLVLGQHSQPAVRRWNTAPRCSAWLWLPLLATLLHALADWVGLGLVVKASQEAKAGPGDRTVRIRQPCAGWQVLVSFLAR